ncbi:PREDICTED: 60S acidic ribosomal protein P2-like [Bison bison bison]|uniref:60S acidic ribosomal protein P2-like n=1 Tax=Bison bison bison TaxID=43346 RepID=A0A6P3IP00_BISBB|nr:PREDICTED: 60S acidic ribosomal protein P2-like [Bison bison bison]
MRTGPHFLAPGGLSRHFQLAPRSAGEVDAPAVRASPALPAARFRVRPRGKLAWRLQAPPAGVSGSRPPRLLSAKHRPAALSFLSAGVISELHGKNIEDVIAQGIGKLASVPAGGAVAVSAAPGSAAPAAGSAPTAAEEKKEEKKEESEESDDDMGFGLFD